MKKLNLKELEVVMGGTNIPLRIILTRDPRNDDKYLMDTTSISKRKYAPSGMIENEKMYALGPDPNFHTS